MYKPLLFAVLWCWCAYTNAQKYDYNWVTGYNSYSSVDTLGGHWFASTHFNFEGEELSISMQKLEINFRQTNTTMSDSAGNILFYFNGIWLYNGYNELIQNGDSLDWSDFVYDITDNYIFGQNFSQLQIALPAPGNDGVYDLFYVFVDTITTPTGSVDAGKKLLRARLDMNANSGRGLVTVKDSVVLNHQINWAAVTAVKHANGRDWWIVTARTNSNCLDVLYYNGSDALTATVQCAGDSFLLDDATSFRFSPDGSKFFLANSRGVMKVYDFDRCTGMMSLREGFIDPQINDTSQWWPFQVEYSPNSRFAYVFCRLRIFQYDMEADNIQNSKTVIAAYSGFQGPLSQTYDNALLAPDGKIYVGSDNSNWYYGIINSPDSPGLACNFTDHSLEVPTFVIGLPTFCNFRLGPLYGSGCDTITSLNKVNAAKEQILNLFPNPANDIVTADYGFTDWNKGPVSLEIANEMGQVIYTQPLPMYSGFQKLNISQFAAGTYTVYIKRNNGVVAVNKLVVVH